MLRFSILNIINLNFSICSTESFKRFSKEIVCSLCFLDEGGLNLVAQLFFLIGLIGKTGCPEVDPELSRD